MKNSDPKFKAALKSYCDQMAAGKGSAQALKATGLNHCQADLAWYADVRNPKAVKYDPKFATMTETAQTAYLVRLRLEKVSWGCLAVITGWSESKVRNFWGRTTGLASEGLRIGRGGRFLSAQPLYYRGNMKGIGLESPKPRSEDPRQVLARSETATSKLPALVKGARKGAAKRVGAKGTAKAKAKPVAPEATPKAEVEVSA